MGFRLNRTYLLKFEGDLAGAEVRIKATPVAALVELTGTIEYERLGELLAEYVIEWNLDDENGETIPLEGPAILANCEEVVLAKILGEWQRAAKGITAPLDGRSTSGEQSPEELIPMDES